MAPSRPDPTRPPKPTTTPRRPPTTAASSSAAATGFCEFEQRGSGFGGSTLDGGTFGCRQFSSTDESLSVFNCYLNRASTSGFEPAEDGRLASLVAATFWVQNPLGVAFWILPGSLRSPGRITEMPPPGFEPGTARSSVECSPSLS